MSTTTWRTVDELQLLTEHRTIYFLSYISNNCIIRNNHKKIEKTNFKCYFFGITIRKKNNQIESLR